MSLFSNNVKVNELRLIFGNIGVAIVKLYFNRGHKESLLYLKISFFISSMPKTM